jgi:hypothetical protein
VALSSLPRSSDMIQMRLGAAATTEKVASTANTAAAIACGSRLWWKFFLISDTLRKNPLVHVALRQPLHLCHHHGK